jgi:hypothetical protein
MLVEQASIIFASATLKLVFSSVSQSSMMSRLNVRRGGFI